MTSAGELAIELAKHECVLVGEFRLTSGLTSPYYIDLRRVPSHPELFDRVADAYISVLKKRGIRFDRIAGVPTAGIPVATLVAYKSKKPFLYVRKEERTHGTQRLVEGVVNPGDRVLLVDDVVTTGGNLQRAIGALRESGARVEHAAVLVDREQGARENLAAAGVELLALMTASELIGELYSKGIISKEDHERVIEYIGREKRA